MKRIWAHFQNSAKKDWECWFLLALNCGAQEADISDLKFGDWKTVHPKECSRFQRLDRRRTKTQKKQGVPPMPHCLWKRTAELLRFFSKGKSPGESIFLRANGNPLRYETPGGRSMNHFFPVPWSNMIKEVVPENPLGFKFLRTTGANLCERKIPGSKFLCLTHSTRTIADIHYANFPLEKLDLVLSYIEKDLGFVDEIVVRTPELKR